MFVIHFKRMSLPKVFAFYAATLIVIECRLELFNYLPHFILGYVLCSIILLYCFLS